jgi:3-oxoacyl-[acyl-carrier-protein] synthase II
VVESLYVTGVGMVTPLGLDTSTTWDALLRGTSGIDQITSFDTEGFATTFAGEVKGFDPEVYVDRKQARRLDRFAQLAVAATSQALAQAGLNLRDGSVDPQRVGVVIGSGIGGILTLSEQWGVLAERGASRVSPFLVPMMLADMASGQVSIIFGAKGANYCVVTACSSGADAIGLASEMVRRGDVDIAIAGGTEAPICPIAVAGFNSCLALSKRNDDPQGASRPFDAGRDGFVMGEGAGVMVIETRESMERRGSRPLAEMAAYGASSDAHHVTQPGPEGTGAAFAMQRAMDQASMQPQDLSYINAHGTGTPLNDKFETMAMKTVLGDEAYKVRISSTKSMTGHLLGAAGGVEAVISVLAIDKGACPPTINLETPDPDCDLDYTPYTPYRGVVRAAMSNNFGFGGHNSSLIFKKPQE